jgi:phosphate transport system substrate-binding protein
VGTTGASARPQSDTLVGAGSTLVAPIMSAWASDFQKKTGVGVTYGAIGSGAGIAQITARTVDFGASDAPMTADQASKANDVLQVPWALAATLVSYNVQGVKNIHLSGLVLSRIYLGKIKFWDDPALKALNTKLKLPHLAITPVFRSDGSGDTYVFTDFLSQTSTAWRSAVGNATAVSFPTGVGAKGNDGVAAAVQQTKGAIGYIAISYVLANHMSYALIRNQANKYVVPNVASISAAAATVGNVPSSNAISIVNPPKTAPTAYPLSTFTYALVPHHSPKAALLKQFLNYATTTGQKFGPPLAFAPLPAHILTIDRATIARITT